MYLLCNCAYYSQNCRNNLFPSPNSRGRDSHTVNRLGCICALISSSLQFAGGYLLVFVERAVIVVIAAVSRAGCLTSATAPATD